MNHALPKDKDTDTTRRNLTVSGIEGKRDRGYRVDELVEVKINDGKC